MFQMPDLRHPQPWPVSARGVERPSPAATFARQILIPAVMGALLAVPTVAMADDDEPAISGAESVGADASGNNAAKKLFTLRGTPDRSAPPTWAGQAQLGYSASSGNSESTDLNANFLISYTAFPWRHFLGAEFRNADADGEKTSERYNVGYKAEYFFSDRTFGFAFLGYDRDPFANIDARYSATVGVGRALLNKERHTLNIELGGGYRVTQYSDDTPEGSEPVVRAAINYLGQLTKNTVFSQDFIVMTGSENTFFESVSALQVAMTDTLALSLNDTVTNNSFTSPGVESTDTFTSINLVATF
jgi:putative salt-induced outer membrane protein